jgi:hypothetical protein
MALVRSGTTTQWQAILERLAEVERFRDDFGMLRGKVWIENIEAQTVTVGCSDDRDALWLQLYTVL